MRLLLPPSEGKNPGGRGRALTARTAAGPLDAARRQALDALAVLLAGPPDAAAGALLLPPGVAGPALGANARVRDSATTPALRRYSGVVYDGLGYATLPPDVQRAAHRSVLIFSGLFGIVRGDEPIPDYRVPAKAALPGLGSAAAFWRPQLQQLLSSPAGRPLLGRGLLVDLRSGDYAAMWRPPRELADRVVTVRVLSPLPRGGHGVVSYSSKLGKGRLAAALLHELAGGHEPTGPADVAAAWLRCGGDAAVPTPNGLDLHTA